MKEIFVHSKVSVLAKVSSKKEKARIVRFCQILFCQIFVRFCFGKNEVHGTEANKGMGPCRTFKVLDMQGISLFCNTHTKGQSLEDALWAPE